MKKKTLSLFLAMCIALTGCSNSSGNNNSNNIATEDFGNIVAGEENTSGLGKIGLYEKFLAGEVPAYCHNLNLKIYNEYQHGEFFTTDSHFTITELYKNMLNYIWGQDYLRDGDYFESAEFAYIDLSNDGEPELLLKLAWDGIWHDNESAPTLYVIIKRLEDKIEILDITAERLLNTYGVVLSSGTIDEYEDEYDNTYYYIDDKCERHLIYHEYDNKLVNSKFANSMDEADKDALSNICLKQLCFEPIHNGELYEHLEKVPHSYITFRWNSYDETTNTWDKSVDDETNALIDKVFNNAGEIRTTDEDFEKEIESHLSNTGLSYVDFKCDNLQYRTIDLLAGFINKRYYE